MGRVRTAFEIAIVLVVSGMAAGMAWDWHHKPSTAATTTYAPAAPIPAAEKIKVVTMPGPPQIVTVEKERVVEKLKLPDAIAKDRDKQVVATAEVVPYAGKTDAVALLDTRTGQAEIELKQEPLPFFGLENGKEVGARAGVGFHGPEGVIYARWTFGPDRARVLGGLRRGGRAAGSPGARRRRRPAQRQAHAGRELQVVKDRGGPDDRVRGRANCEKEDPNLI
jgi:hypothetical protein